jgi:SnoaL-like domain
VEPTRCRRRVGIDDRRFRLGGYQSREPHGTLYTGRADVRAAIVEAFKALPDVKCQPVRNSFGENHVVVELLVTGTLGDGSKARFHACDILTLRDGLIAAKRSYRKVVE